MRRVGFLLEITLSETFISRTCMPVGRYVIFRFKMKIPPTQNRRYHTFFQYRQSAGLSCALHKFTFKLSSIINWGFIFS